MPEEITARHLKHFWPDLVTLSFSYWHAAHSVKVLPPSLSLTLSFSVLRIKLAKRMSPYELIVRKTQETSMYENEVC